MGDDAIRPAGGHQSPFERIKRTNDAGVEFWSSREFAGVLGYGDYRNFEGVVEKAKLACFNSGHRVEDHFVEVTEMVAIGSEDVHRRMGLKKGQNILDHMGSTELAANLFRATQAEEKLRREQVRGKDAANRAHRQVGAKVPQTIEELGGTMPEKLPIAESIKKLEGQRHKRLGKAERPEDKKEE